MEDLESSPRFETMNVSAPTKGIENPSLKLKKCYVPIKRLTFEDIQKFSDSDRNFLKKSQCRDHAKITGHIYNYDCNIQEQPYMIYYKILHQLQNGVKIEDIDFNPCLRCTVNLNKLSDVDLKRTKVLHNLLNKKVFKAVYEPREFLPAILREVIDIMKHGGNLSGLEGDKVINLVRILKSYLAQCKNKCGKKKYVIENPQIYSDEKCAAECNSELSLKIAFNSKQIEIDEELKPPTPEIDILAPPSPLKNFETICPFCHTILGSEVALAFHTCNGKRFQGFQCNVCKKKFCTGESYKNHFKIHPITVQSSENIQPSEIEMDILDPPSPLKNFETICTFCNTILGSEVALAFHTCNGKRFHGFQCNVCKKKFYTGKSYKNHFKIHPITVQSSENIQPSEIEMEEEIKKEISPLEIKRGKWAEVLRCGEVIPTIEEESEKATLPKKVKSGEDIHSTEIKSDEENDNTVIENDEDIQVIEVISEKTIEIIQLDSDEDIHPTEAESEINFEEESEKATLPKKVKSGEDIHSTEMKSDEENDNTVIENDEDIQVIEVISEKTIEIIQLESDEDIHPSEVERV